jgi:SAM-dependent methyltransferase
MAGMFMNAAAYEGMMGRWSIRLAPLFANFAQVVDGNRVLDVGCGTGSLVQAIADMTRRSEIVGIDPAQPFIDYARARFTEKRIAFDCGNAMALPYPDGAFAQSLSSLVFMFIPNPAKAAQEMRRVTRAGGSAAVCIWDRDGLEMSAIFFEEATRLDPDAEARAQRPQHCNREGDLFKLWRATGFEDVKEAALEIQSDFASFDDYWTPFAKGVGPQGVYVAGLTAERRDALREALRMRLLADGPDGPFSLAGKAWAVRGTIPG